MSFYIKIHVYTNVQLLQMDIKYIYFEWVNEEWVLFSATVAIFNYIIAKTSYIWWGEDDYRSVQDPHTLVDFYNAISLKQ
jgi:hypothetical protein